MYQYSQGKSTKQAHKKIPNGCFEEEQGRKGFYGPVSHLIRKKPSTRWSSIKGPLKPRMFDMGLSPNTISRSRLLYNTDVELSMEWKDVSTNPSSAFRNADGDSIYFCHRGKGNVLTEYGLLSYREGDYIMLPKCVAHTLIPKEVSSFFIIVSKSGSFGEPDRGIAGRHALYDIEQIGVPSLQEQEEFLQHSGAEVLSIDVRHNGEVTTFEYTDSIYDVIGWKGDFFPFRLNMDQIMPLVSHRIHLPPSAHTTFVAPQFVVCSFVPRPLESEEDVLKVPFYHQNIDYDEVLFYHNGDFFSRSNLHAGMMSFHPAGFPHGPHPSAVDKVKDKTFHNEYAVMVDVRRPLFRDSTLDNLEIKDYWKSWQR